VDSQQRPWGALSGRLVVAESEIAESGWVPVDLAAYEAIPPAAPVTKPEPALEIGPEPVPEAGDADARAAIQARLVAWAERVRGGGAVAENGDPEPRAEAAPMELPEPIRRVPHCDIIKIERKASRALVRAQTRAPVRLQARLPRVRPIHVPEPVAAPRDAPRPKRSLRLRIVLLALAAVYVLAGLTHAYARWKSNRVIVVPATADSSTVIT
jgi:hypothetical protein